jgi:hypothetical protein
MPFLDTRYFWAFREAKRKTRAASSFSDAAYQHYDPATEGYGSVDEWIAAAEALCSGRGIYRATKQTGKRINPDLVTLNLTDSTISTWRRGNRYSTSGAAPDTTPPSLPSLSAHSGGSPQSKSTRRWPRRRERRLPIGFRSNRF